MATVKLLPAPGMLSTRTVPPSACVSRMHDVEPEPDAAVTPAVGAVGLAEHLEDDAELLRRNADAGVGDA